MAEEKYKSIAIGAGVALGIVTLAFLALAGFFVWREIARARQVAASSSSPSSPSPTPLSIPDLVKTIKPSVVIITTYDYEGKSTGLGSGFFIAPTQVVSNWHVIEDSFRAEIKTASGETYHVKGTVALDKASDLALLQIDIPPNLIAALTMAQSGPVEGERIVAVGNPLGLEGTISDGIVSGIREIPDLGRLMQITAPVSPGSSGGPVVNMTGQVIGVTRASLKVGQNLNFAVPGEKVLDLKAGALKTLPELVRADAEKYYTLAKTYAEKGDYDKALEQADEAIEKDPSYEEAWFQVGYSAGELGDYKRAFAAYVTVTKLNPRSFTAYYNMGIMDNKLQLWDEAVSSLTTAATINPKDPDTQFGLAIAQCNKGETQGAVKAYRRLLILSQSKAQNFADSYSTCLESADTLTSP
jgi:S1-C subfamily serine protease